jgi:hypothetical protein
MVFVREDEGQTKQDKTSKGLVIVYPSAVATTRKKECGGMLHVGRQQQRGAVAS